MLQASWNGMLIDWKRAGPERRFEVRVLNVLQAGKFYRNVSELTKRSGRKRTTARCFGWDSRSDVLDSLSLRKAISSGLALSDR
jgi:hypothetical protein